MRLVACVAIELAVGAVLASAVSLGVLWSWPTQAAALPRPAETAATAPHAPPPPQIAEAPRVVDRRLDAPIAPPRPGSGRFMGEPDEVLLAPLRDGAIASVKFNRGGSSLSLRIDFEGGARAAFKPEQLNLQTVPRKEVAAYRVARLLGLENVAPAVGRRFRVADLRAKLRPDATGLWPRFVAEARTAGEFVDGELAYWIPEIRDATIGGARIDSTEGIMVWKRLLLAGATIPEDQRALAAQISDLVLFDFVINNPDRWSGNNTKASPDGRTLFIMDNAMAFQPDPRGGLRVRTYLERAQAFSRARIERLRALDEATLREATAWDREPYDALLTEREIAGILSRREIALGYVDRLIAAHGDDAVLRFP